MQTAIAELSELCPPSEDGGIGHALAELESKLDAWSSAMHAMLGGFKSARAIPGPAPAHDASKEPLCAASQESPSAHAPDNVTADPAALVERLTQAMAHSEHLERYDDTATPENGATAEPVPRSCATDEEAETVLASMDAQVATQLRTRHKAARGAKTLGQVCDEYFEEVADAERLLGTLEPEMAKAIRVQYRLFNGRKSIHELVKAYEPPKENARKKSWWRG